MTETNDTSDAKATGHWFAASATVDDAGQRLDKWLASQIDLSRARLRTLIESGDVRANGDVIKNPSA